MLFKNEDEDKTDLNTISANKGLKGISLVTDIDRRLKSYPIYSNLVQSLTDFKKLVLF